MIDKNRIWSERKNVNTTLNKELYKRIQLLGLETNKNANELIEEGMRMVLQKYKSETYNNYSK